MANSRYTETPHKLDQSPHTEHKKIENKKKYYFEIINSHVTHQLCYSHESPTLYEFSENPGRSSVNTRRVLLRGFWVPDWCEVLSEGTTKFICGVGIKTARIGTIGCTYALFRRLFSFSLEENNIAQIPFLGIPCSWFAYTHLPFRQSRYLMFYPMLDLFRSTYPSCTWSPWLLCEPSRGYIAF